GLQWSSEKLGDKHEADQEAQSFMAKYPTSPYSPDIELRLADSKFHAEDYAAAVTQYQDFTQRYPQSPLLPRAYFWMGTAQVKDGKMNEGAQAFQKVIRLYPQDPLALESQFSLASVYFEQGNFAQALAGYSDLVSRYPDHRLAPHALFNSAVCEKQMGKGDQALEDFARLTQKYPSDPLAFEAQVQRGILLEKAGRSADALAAYAEGTKSPDPELAVEASFYHADLRRELGQYPQAVREFNDLVARFPGEDQWVVTAMAQIAKCYEEQKKYEKAYQAYERILKYTKDKAYQAATLKHLKALKPFLKKTAAPPAASAAREARP
ncbi:MAG TPA: tetratricopeptide repeat protein, partial [bacterium]|nr:tetratricopeptide repeat protein [bacterium]